jgi:hypothetical protein
MKPGKSGYFPWLMPYAPWREDTKNSRRRFEQRKKERSIMENELIAAQGANSTAAVYRRNDLRLPLIALGLDLYPVLIVWLSPFIPTLPSFIYLCIILSPIAGLITGVISLILGKRRIGAVGKILAIIAIVFPLALAAALIIVLSEMSTRQTYM